MNQYRLNLNSHRLNCYYYRLTFEYLNYDSFGDHVNSSYAYSRFIRDITEPLKLTKYLKSKKIKFTRNPINEDFILKLPSKDSELKLLQDLQKQKIQIVSFNEVGNKLDDIYKKLIRFGSVDTMGSQNEKSK